MPRSAPIFKSKASVSLRKQTDKQHNDETSQTYNYQWKKLRKQKLASDPLCERCLQDERYTLATIVHHKQPVVDRPDLRLDMDNLESTCVKHHGEAHRHKS